MCSCVMCSEGIELNVKLLRGMCRKYGQLTGRRTSAEDHKGVKPLQLRRRESFRDDNKAIRHRRARSTLFLSSSDVVVVATEKATSAVCN